MSVIWLTVYGSENKLHKAIEIPIQIFVPNSMYACLKVNWKKEKDEENLKKEKNKENKTESKQKRKKRNND